MAQFDNHRFAYYRFIRDRHLYPDFKRWVEKKNPREGVSSVRLMALYLVHKGIRNDMVDNPRYDRDALANVIAIQDGLEPIFDLTDDEYEEVIRAKWLDYEL